MKRNLAITFSLLLLASLSLGARNEKTSTIPASDSRITIIGRTWVDGANVSFDWSGVYARVSFKGTYLAMRASDTHRNYYNVWIDKSTDQEPDKIISTHGSDSLIVLFSPEELLPKYTSRSRAEAASHLVTIQKRTEGEQGRTTLHSFETTGDFLQAPGIKDRVIEIIGDSYTCGYGSENSVKEDPFKPETENCNKSYSCIVPRYFDADYIHVAHSGMGIARNYNDNVKGWYMPERYSQAFDMDRESRWDAASSGISPDVTIIYLCTNDFSVSRQPSKEMFARNYVTLLRKIKENWGEDHPILCVGSRSDYLIIEYIHEAVATCGMKNVSMVAMGEDIHNLDSDLGASWHPNYKGHIKKAFNLIPYVSTMTGWEMTDQPVR